MKAIRFGIFALLAALTLPVAAQAADMPLKAPALVRIAPWSGFYLGVEAGAKWNDIDWTNTCNGAIPAFCAPDGTRLAGNPFTVDASSPRSFDGTALRLGAYAGYNWQIANWVVGLEGDLAWSEKKDTIAGLVGCTINCGFRASGTGDLTQLTTNWDGAIRARLGYVVTPDMLLYIAGGLAAQDVNATEFCTVAGPWCIATRVQKVNDTMWGWTAGGGLEYRIMSNWIARGEYRYSDFGDFKPVFFGNSADATLNTIKVKTHQATFGLSYLIP